MTRDQFIEQIGRQIAASKAYGSTAPVAQVLTAVLADVQKLDDMPATTQHTDRMLTAKQVAARMGLSERTIYKNRGGYPFARQYPGGSLRFSERGLESWLLRQI